MFHKIGVSAIDGGFIPMVTTTSGSDTLHKAATGGSLGGLGNVPRELSELKVRFRELIGEGEKKGVRTAGFGTEEEATELRKDGVYGR